MTDHNKDHDNKQAQGNKPANAPGQAQQGEKSGQAQQGEKSGQGDKGDHGSKDKQPQQGKPSANG
ncbi:hypothetical protein [Paraurantiacibacter namhicola]|uniref:Uncharacterized protein n=1 Tax=Paraurantiacibacter namhicola TaxID=645517 RepID=A0A1C7D6Q5_9SPHN|nr:hypothetical protein [Paraurantiacibacter namhicola]ANU07011.1 hypothetical protein A6F65_00689 [Paraurantiacibacter namhicola]